MHKILTAAIALVWLVNGLFCKVLAMVPRHQQIVAQILGENYAYTATKAIGLLEILMFVWIISRIKPRFCALTQIAVVATMNIIEFFLVPNLLLFGHINALFAAIFIAVVYINAFVIDKTATTTRQAQ